MKLSLITSSSLFALVALAATGCASAPASAEEAATDEALGSGITVPNPSGDYVASVIANGTGCPAGTWDATISPDGHEFKVTFSQYEVFISPGQALQIKDCTLMIDLRSPAGLSFAVTDFAYQGYALLDSPGMIARQTARYYFSGNPLPARTNYTDMPGPYNDAYLFQDEILTADLVWSPCGPSRRLNAQTRLVVQNNPQKSGSGYVNTDTVDANVSMIFRWNLSWRQC